MTPVVSLRGLSKHFGSVEAVESLTFDVAKGELFGIVGPDGAGKTTTLRMLAGVLRPTAGEAFVASYDVGRDPESVKPHIAYMAQRFGLYDDLTVQENLDFYTDVYGVPETERRSRQDRLFAFSRLGEFKDRLAGKLSGGMKQKLSLSCCLVHKPDVLLLDEPTFGVDPISRRELWLILHEMVAEGVTVLVSTSYLDEAERCDRVALLHEGRILALDTPTRLQSSMAGTMLSVQSDRPRAARDVLRNARHVLGASLFGDTVHVHTPSLHAIDETTSTLTQADLNVLSIQEIEPSLEDIFIDFVQARSNASNASNVVDNA